MIPINQLRVGSYWQLNTKTGQVLKIVTPCEIADAAEYGIGVIITPDVLEKLGFELNDEENLRYIHEGFTYSIMEGEVWFGTSMIDCHHLHQLQNLVFALTGTELKYNL